MSEPLVKIHNLQKKFGNKVVLSNLNLVISNGDYISIMGQSGSGKTTLLNILGLLDNDFEGDYLINGQSVKKIKNLFYYRSAYFGFVFQSYYLLNELSVKENILLPTIYSESKDDKKTNKIFNFLVKFLGIEDLLDRKINVLSGGEKQRIAIARALINDPSILICDELTGNLDERNREIILSYLKKINELGKTIIIVTHDVFVFNSSHTRYRFLNGSLINEKNI